MIDFRYHVVSLVAVFIALAVGIVLGAGPLREGISDTLEGEVSQLRAERGELRADLDSARSRADDKDSALGTLNDRVVAGTLTGARVAVVLLPATDRNQSARVEDGIEAAGGEVVLTVDVDTDLEALEGPDERALLVDELRASLLMGQEREAGDQAAPEQEALGLGPVLGTALLGADAPGQTGAWLAALDRLDEEGYVDVTWRGEAQASVLDRLPPEVVLVLDGELPADAGGEPTRASVAALAERGALVDRLMRGNAAVVVAGAGGESGLAEAADQKRPLVALVRADRDLHAEVSTVDNLESAAGRLSAVLALGWELDGKAGHYGQVDPVDAAVPAPPPLRFGAPTVPSGDDDLVTEPVPDPQTEDLDGTDPQGAGEGGADPDDHAAIEGDLDGATPPDDAVATTS